MFNGCKSLLNLPDTSKWNTSNVVNKIHMLTTFNNFGYALNVQFKILGRIKTNIIAYNDMIFKDLIDILIKKLNITETNKLKFEFSHKIINADCFNTLEELGISNYCIINVLGL